jgi:hypothetical protein
MVLVVLVLAALASIPAACQQPQILSTISCPVYVPPETPRPEWPKQCGGQR